MTTIFTTKYFFACACRDLGLEDAHTIAIGRIVEAQKDGRLEADHANALAKRLYNDGRRLRTEESEESE